MASRATSFRVAAALAATYILAAASPVWAVGNPPGCTQPLVAIEILEFRDFNDDGMPDQQLQPFETKSPGDVILYQAVLTHSGAERCGYEDGRVCIDTPEIGCADANPAVPTFDPPSFTTVGPGECCAVDQINPVPLVCDPTVCAPPPGPDDRTARYESDYIRYVVDPADAANNTLCPSGTLRATAFYDVGFSKQGTPTSPDVFPANASIPICNPVEVEVRHFMCYEPDRMDPGLSVTLMDRFRSVTAEVNNLKRICNPADKNGEDPAAVNFPNHLASYEIDAPAFTNTKIQVTNQFGTAELELRRAIRLMVPTAKGALGPPPQAPGGPPNPPMIDHFQCYTARGPAARQTVIVDDQFGQLSVDVRQPDHVCVPVNKNNEGFVGGNGAFGTALVCYDVRTTPRRQNFTGDFIMDNQLTGGPFQSGLHGPRELCVQSTILVQ